MFLSCHPFQNNFFKIFTKKSLVTISCSNFFKRWLKTLKTTWSLRKKISRQQAAIIIRCFSAFSLFPPPTVDTSINFITFFTLRIFSHFRVALKQRFDDFKKLKFECKNVFSPCSALISWVLSGAMMK